MEVIEQYNSEGPIFKKFVRDGIAGNYDVVYQMIRVIRSSVDNDKQIEHVAKSILIDNGLDSYSAPEDQLQAIFDYVQKRVKYVEDQAGLIESLKSARVTLADGYGDCDDQTNTNATLAGCIGFEKVCIAMARYSPSDTSFVHVYCVVYDRQGNRFVLDTTLPHGQFNDEVTAIEIKEISVFDTVQGLDGVSGLFNNTKHHAVKLGKALIESMPLATNFLPLSFLSSHAFTASAGMLAQSGSPQLSLAATGSKINKALDTIIVELIQSSIAFDIAKSEALQLASQLSAVELDQNDAGTYVIVKESIQRRLDFIKNFRDFAAAHDIRVIELDPHLMLCAGLAGAGVGGYLLYKMWKGSN